MPDALNISRKVSLPVEEIELTPIRAQGPGGQHVNKTASAVHLRFDVAASSLPDFYKERLLQLNDQRLTREGVIVLKSQEHRSQEANREAALQRLGNLIREVGHDPKPRRPTRPTRGSQRRRVEGKKQRGRVKALRGRVE